MTTQPDRQECTCGQAGHGNAHEPGCPRSSYRPAQAPARPEEDGLLPCPFCGSEPKCNGRPGSVMGQIYCDSEECFGPRTTALTKRDSVAQWNTRATPQPARDAAEGATEAEAQVSVLQLLGTTETADVDFLLERLGLGLHGFQRDVIASFRRQIIGAAVGAVTEISTPPKPAPDAMDNCPSCGSSAPHMHPAVQHEGEVELCPDEFHLRPTNQTTAAYIAAVEAKRALSAPVPPGDERCKNCTADNCAYIKGGYGRCPSGTGAAEPVAYICDDLILPAREVIPSGGLANARLNQPHYWRLTPLYAAPPVRGDRDREALLKYLDIFLHPNPTVDLSGLVCKHGLAIEACAARECSNPMAYETAIKRARDYIAALPVPPGAGEREAVIEESENTDGHRMLTVKSSRGEDFVIDADAAALALANFFSDLDNERKQGWTLNGGWYSQEIQTLRNTCRQAPPSSSEGGR